AMKTPAVRERLEGLGAGIVPGGRATPGYLGQVVKSEIEKGGGPIKASGGEGGLRGGGGGRAPPTEGAPPPRRARPLFCCERAIPPSVTVALAGNFSLPLSLPSAKAWRTAFSISRWALTPSVLRNLRMLPLNTSSFMIASVALLYACVLTNVPVPFFMLADRH